MQSGVGEYYTVSHGTQSRVYLFMDMAAMDKSSALNNHGMEKQYALNNHIQVSNGINLIGNYMNNITHYDLTLVVELEIFLTTWRNMADMLQVLMCLLT